jgi:hypothetical protein
MTEVKLFFVVGAQKSGTTALFDYCCNLEGFVVPLMKEPHLLNLKSDISLNEYLKEIGVKNGLTGDFSPSYLYSHNAPENIKRLFPNSPIVIILRNPMERAISNMIHNVRLGREPIFDLNVLVNSEKERLLKNNSYHYMSKSLYYAQVKRYIDTFGRNQLLILRYEDMKHNTEEFLHNFSDFVGLKQNKHFELTIRNTGHIGKNQFVQSILSRYSKLIGFNSRVDRLIPKSLKKVFKRKMMKTPDLPSKSWILEGNKKYFKDDLLQLEELLNMSFLNWYD